MYKKLSKLLVLLILFSSLLLGAESRSAYDPYTMMVGARSYGMGKTSSAVGNDFFAIYSNPAAINRVKDVQIGLFSARILEEVNHFTVGSIFDTPWGKAAFSYTSVGMSDIPETSLIYDGVDYRIEGTGDSYDINDKVYSLAYAIPQTYNWGLFKNVDVAVMGKIAQSTVGDKMMGGWGLDVGTRFDLTPKWAEGYHFGFALQNLLAPTFQEKKSEDEGETSDEEGPTKSSYPMNIRMGVAKMYKIYGYDILAAFDFDNDGIHMGGEYKIDKAVALRGGFDVDSFTFGVGLKSFTFTGIDYNPYTISFDYAYHMYSTPLENLHLFSFSVLGVTRTTRPTIETPVSGASVTSNSIMIQGTAQAQSEVIIYVNNKMRKVAYADSAGVWRAAGLFVDEGKNEIYVVSQYEAYVESDPSQKIIIDADMVLPELEAVAVRKGDLIVIEAKTNKNVKAVVSKLPDNSKLLLQYNENREIWRGAWTITDAYQEKYLEIRTLAIDKNGTKSNVVISLISTKIIEYPKDKTIVEKEFVTLRGKVGADIKLVIVDGREVTPGVDGRFSITVPLEEDGKNVLEVVAIDDDGEQTTSSIRILKLKTAPDTENLTWSKRAVNDLLTIGVLELSESNNFEPKDYVTREEFARYLTFLRGLPLVKDKKQIANDVGPDNPNYPYIRAVLDVGYMLRINNNFNPENFITRAEAVMAIVRMDDLDTHNVKEIMGYKDVPEDAFYYAHIAAAYRVGIITDSEYFYPDRELSREAAAVMLSRSKYAQQKIESLYDWKRGYGEQFFEAETLEGELLDDLYINGELISFGDEEEELVIISPQDQDIVYRPTVLLKGLYRGESVTVNGIAVAVDKENNIFIAEIGLQLGKNLILIQGGEKEKLLRILRLKAFADVGEDDDEMSRHVIASAGIFGDEFSEDTFLMRSEMLAIFAYLKGEEEVSVENDKEVTWAEAVKEINKFSGKEEDDQEILEGVTDYQEDRLITRGEFIDLLDKTLEFQRVLDDYKDFESFEDEKYKSNKIRKRELILDDGSAERGSDESVAFSLGDKRDFQNGDPYLAFLAEREGLVGKRDIERTGESIVSGGTALFQIFYPKNNFVISDPYVEVRGVNKNKSRVAINDREISVDKNGAFRQRVPLSKGRNIIVVTAGQDRFVVKGLRLVTYADIENLSIRRAIEYLATLGYFREGGFFKPQTQLTRAEFCSLLVRASNIKPEQVFSDPFSDVSAKSAVAPVIQVLKDKNIVSGNEFRPNQAITEGDAAIWMKKLLQSTPKVANKDAILTKETSVKWLVKLKKVQKQILILKG